MTYRRFLLWLSSLYHWPSWSFRVIVGNSTTSSQLEAGSIMVRAIKSIDKLSLPLRVYGPMRSTHRASQGVNITILDGRCPYFSDCFLFIRQVLHDFVYGSDGGTHSYPVYCSFHCLFETGMPGVLKIMVIPYRCVPLQWLWHYEATFIFNKLKF